MFHTREGSHGGETVHEYLAAVSWGQPAALATLRQTIKAVLPEATEVISYQIPASRERKDGGRKDRVTREVLCGS